MLEALVTGRITSFPVPPNRPWFNSRAKLVSVPALSAPYQLGSLSLSVSLLLSHRSSRIHLDSCIAQTALHPLGNAFVLDSAQRACSWTPARFAHGDIESAVPEYLDVASYVAA